MIDCQPSLGLLTVNALAASTGVIVPLECEYFALRGVALLKGTIDKVQERLNPKLEIVGLLGTMFDGRTLHSREVLQTLVDGWGDAVFHTVIRRTVKFSEATVAGEPLLAYAGGLPGRRGVPAACPGGAGSDVTPGKASRGRRAVPPDQADARGRPVTAAEPVHRRRRARAAGSARTPTAACARRSAAADGPTKAASGRVKHDEKITVYVTADELLDLEHTRLTLASRPRPGRRSRADRA